MEVVAEHPLTVYDGAHNPAGASALAESLDDVFQRRPRVAVIGVLEDKDAAGMLRELLPRVDRAVYTHSANPRSLSPGTLGSLAQQLGGRRRRPWPTRVRRLPGRASWPGRTERCSRRARST